jgi:hypothetical protein
MDTWNATNSWGTGQTVDGLYTELHDLVCETMERAGGLSPAGLLEAQYALCDRLVMLTSQPVGLAMGPVEEIINDLSLDGPLVVNLDPRAELPEDGIVSRPVASCPGLTVIFGRQAYPGSRDRWLRFSFTLYGVEALAFKKFILDLEGVDRL